MVALDFGAVLSEWPLLLRGVAFTLGLTAISAVVGVGLGVACGWARAWGPVWLRHVVGVYVELIRNTPFIVQLFFVFFGLPSLGVRLTPELASVIAMVINLGAYACEIVMIVLSCFVFAIVIVMLGSAVCGQIATQELSYYANLIQSRNFRAFESFIVATAIYLLLSILLRQALHWIGPKWLFGRVPQAGR